MFELWDRRDSLVKQFSGGTKRRLEVARALLHTPTILFLDEPTLGLDPQSRNRLWAQVGRLNDVENMTVLLTTHNLDEAERMAHRVAVMDHGKLIALGSQEELKARTATPSLEQAFLALTGTALRDADAGSLDRLRQVATIAGR